MSDISVGVPCPVTTGILSLESMKLEHGSTLPTLEGCPGHGQADRMQLASAQGLAGRLDLVLGQARPSGGPVYCLALDP